LSGEGTTGDVIPVSSPVATGGEVSSPSSETLHTPQALAPDAPAPPDVPLRGVELLGHKGDTVAYLRSLSATEQAKVFRDFRLFTTEILQPNSLPEGDFLSYDPATHPEFAQIDITQVLFDRQTIEKSPFSSYDRIRNPLHWSQMGEVTRFVEASVEAFGEEFGRAKPGETIREYVLRMAALARSSGKRIGIFHMVE
jgi:hypothetical protein